jgi:hypothetical protein
MPAMPRRPGGGIVDIKLTETCLTDLADRRADRRPEDLHTHRACRRVRRLQVHGRRQVAGRRYAEDPFTRYRYFLVRCRVRRQLPEMNGLVYAQTYMQESLL